MKWVTLEPGSCQRELQKQSMKAGRGDSAVGSSESAKSNAAFQFRRGAGILENPDFPRAGMTNAA